MAARSARTPARTLELRNLGRRVRMPRRPGQDAATSRRARRQSTAAHTPGTTWAPTCATYPARSAGPRAARCTVPSPPSTHASAMRRQRLRQRHLRFTAAIHNELESARQRVVVALQLARKPRAGDHAKTAHPRERTRRVRAAWGACACACAAAVAPVARALRARIEGAGARGRGGVGARWRGPGLDRLRAGGVRAPGARGA